MISQVLLISDLSIDESVLLVETCFTAFFAFFKFIFGL